MNNLLTQKIPITAFALLLVVGMSCSHEPAVENGSPDENIIHEWEDSAINGDASMTRMMFSVSNGLTVERTGSTRGTNATDGQSYTFDANELITIGIKDRGTKNYKVTNTTTGALTYNGAAADAFCWLNTSETVKLRAWSYGNTTKTTDDPDDAVYTLPADQHTNYGEFLYSPATDYDYATYKTGITLPLYHQLSRVVINISYDSGSSLTNVRIGDGTMTIPRTAKFHKPSTGNNYGTWDTFGSETNQIIPMEETANTCYSAVLIPGNYAAGSKFFNITIGDEVFSYTLADALTLQAGRQYNYNVKIKNRQVTFTVTVTAWTTDTRSIDFSE